MINKEKVDILLKYFGTPAGNIDLSDIDFGNRTLFNSNQKANEIYNNGQQAIIIYNNNQKANIICNFCQQAIEIDNSDQIIKTKYDYMSKEELIEEIKKLKGE